MNIIKDLYIYVSNPVILVIFICISLLGVISLITMIILEDDCWKNFYVKEVSVLSRFIAFHKPGIKSMLFFMGLAYVYSLRSKMLFLLSSLAALLFCLNFLEEDSLALYFSVILFLANVIVLWTAKHEMNRRFVF